MKFWFVTAIRMYLKWATNPAVPAPEHATLETSVNLPSWGFLWQTQVPLKYPVNLQCALLLTELQPRVRTARNLEREDNIKVTCAHKYATLVM
jgi:hypothetical protein